VGGRLEEIGLWDLQEEDGRRSALLPSAKIGKAKPGFSLIGTSTDSGKQDFGEKLQLRSGSIELQCCRGGRTARAVRTLAAEVANGGPVGLMGFLRRRVARAMMLAILAAACRNFPSGLCCGKQSRAHEHPPKDQHQEFGDKATHLNLSVHESAPESKISRNTGANQQTARREADVRGQAESQRARESRSARAARRRHSIRWPAKD
jgi:hypothetical protein